jgi:hypothetical protein
MNIHAPAGLIIVITLVLYLIVPVVVCIRGRIITGGLAMLVISAMPMIWQSIDAPDSEAPGSGMLMVMLMPLALIVILVGIADLIYRGFSRLRGRAAD